MAGGMGAAATTDLSITVTSDAICPWCYVGKHSLQRAVRQLGISVDVSWRPFQLDPAMPRGGMPYGDYMLRKFGSPRGFEGLRQRIEGFAKELGVDIEFARVTHRPNTLDAHRVIHWAGEQDCQDAVVEGLFAAFFKRGLDVGDAGVLGDVASQAGMDGDEIRVWLAEGRDEALVRELADDARTEHGITGVPAFDLGGVITIPGAQSSETFVRMIPRVLEKLSGAR